MHSSLCFLACFAFALSAIAAADAGGAAAPADAQPTQVRYKFTASSYRVSDGNDAIDLNLRANTDDWTFWGDYYAARDGFRQARTGLERNLDYGNVRLVLSGQLASRGFVGGSISGEIGGDTFAIVGFGRTNLRDYVNLNFDPNDAVTLGVGHRNAEGFAVSVFIAFDDRLGTGQRVTHAVLRDQLTAASRLTVDVFHESDHGLDAPPISATGLSVAVDVQPYFIKVASDPNVNFTANRMTRLSLGMRF
jgi:hypothetical protein